MYSQLEKGRYLHLSGVPVAEYKAKSVWKKAFNIASGFMTLPEIYIPVGLNLLVGVAFADAAKDTFQALPYYAYGLGVHRALVWSMELTEGLRKFSDGFSSKKYFDTQPVGQVTSDKDMKAAKYLRKQFSLFAGGGALVVLQSAVTLGIDNPLGLIVTGFVSTVATPFAFAARRYHKVVNKTWAITDTIPEQQDTPIASLNGAEPKPVYVRN